MNLITGNKLHYLGGNNQLPTTPLLKPTNSGSDNESEYDTADEITNTADEITDIPQDAPAEVQIPLCCSTHYKKNPEQYVEIYYSASTNRIELINTVEK